MRLTRIEAVRYGGVENATLSGLGHGLTVVVGPNEAGKSTYSALVRGVLYGFPRVSAGTKHYKPEGAGRDGRLVFTDGDGEWAIERVEGPKGGPVLVKALDGSERPGLLSDLTAGVTDQSFRVVFGFGLDELGSVGNAEGSEIVARLYAADYGLEANPMDVARLLDDRASSRFKAGGHNPTVNLLNTRIRDTKSQIHMLEEQAKAFSSEQLRARALAEQLVPLRVRRDELEALSRAFARDLGRLEDALESSRGSREELLSYERHAAELRGNLDVIDVDARVLVVEPALTAVLGEVSGFRQRVEAMEAARAAAGDIERRIGAGTPLPAGARDSVENRVAVDAWQEKLLRMRLAEETAEAASVKLSAQASGTAAVANTVESERPPATANKTSLFFAAAVLLVGVVFAAAGFVLSPPQIIVSALGGLVAAIGLLGVVLASLRRPAAAPTSTLSADAARQLAEAEAARAVAQDASDRFAAAQSEWRAWLAERSLDAHGDDPSAVRQLLDELKGREGLLGEAARLHAEADRAQEAAESWVIRLVELVSGFDPAAAQLPSLNSAPELMERARFALERAIKARAERAEITRELATTVAARDVAANRAASAEAILVQLVASHGLEPTDPLPGLQSLAAMTAGELSEAASSCEGVAEELAQLRGKLDEEGRDDSMARARQTLEGMQAEVVSEADRYVVEKLAVHLVNASRERFDTERQPEVRRIASRVFSAMTQGRYTGVRTQDEKGIAVVTAGGAHRLACELSTGTVEQLYLALRVGLISSLGNLGADLPILMDDIAANFDAERLVAATVAIGELTAVRQVVYFTCHEATAEALVAAVPGSALVKLDRCELRG